MSDNLVVAPLESSLVPSWSSWHFFHILKLFWTVYNTGRRIYILILADLRVDGWSQASGSKKTYTTDKSLSPAAMDTRNKLFDNYL